MSPPSLHSDMSRDRSLDEFVGGESDGSADPGSDADADDSTDAEDPTDDSTDAEDPTDDSDVETGSEPAPCEEGSGGSDAADDDAATAPDDVEPAAVTYRWEPDGVRCADCGAAAEQLWSGESGQVCADCKEW